LWSNCGGGVTGARREDMERMCKIEDSTMQSRAHRSHIDTVLYLLCSSKESIYIIQNDICICFGLPFNDDGINLTIHRVKMVGKVLKMFMVRRIIPSIDPLVFRYQCIGVLVQCSIIIHIYEIIIFENNPDLCSQTLGSFCKIALSDEYFCCVNKPNI
jgi:hypothetical protein